MSKRVAAPPRGMTYFDANRHCLVTVEGEALEVKRRIEERWPELEVYFDKDRLKFIIIQTHYDGVTQSLLFEEEKLSEATIARIHGDDRYGGEEMLADIDAHNEKVEADIDARFMDKMGDFTERFRHALKKDGIYDHMDIFGTRN